MDGTGFKVRFNITQNTVIISKLKIVTLHISNLQKLLVLFLRPQLSSLQPLQITELEAEFAKIEGQKAQPTRYVKSQQKKQAKIMAESEATEG